jgi:hypothetical protein
MSPDNKRAAINMTYLQMIEIARYGNKFFEQATRKHQAPKACAMDG